MARLAFLADEHVSRAYCSALRSNGYHVERVGSEYEPGTTDEAVLAQGLKANLVLLTNDDDFVELAAGREHAGIIFYQQYGHTPGTFVRAIGRIDRYLSVDDFENHVEWLENWL